VSSGYLIPGAYLSGNQLLDALSPDDRAGLEEDLEIIVLAAHKTTHFAGGLVDYVDFPIDAVVSIVASLENGDTVEVGTIGSEGFVETDVALHSPQAQRTSFCQVNGTVGRMRIARFQARMAASPTFAALMRRNVRAALFSAQQFAACNVKHSILQRCARWLLMTQDRVGSAEFMLTQEFLAIMLGVRRASVSEAAEALQALGAITYRRGAVVVLNTALLRANACECYEACKAAYAAALAE
jgi:CRP-like cAMP-binding protein